MHVCMLTTTHDLLDDRIFYKEALSLTEKGIEITILGTGSSVERVERGIKLLSIPRDSRLVSRFKVLERVVQRARSIECDAYHFHEPELLKVGLALKKITGRLVIFDAHEHYPDMMLNTTRLPKVLRPIAAWAMDKWERHYVPKMDMIITADNNIEKRYLEMNSRVASIFNYPILDLFYNAQPDPELAKRYRDRDLIIYEGGIARVRGPMELLAALKQLKDTHPRVKLIFVGPFTDAACEQDMSRYIQENQLEPWVELVGNVPHTKIPGYILASKVGMVTLLPVPKFFKNIPIKQFEYMACGIPVVGSNLPPIRSYVEQAACGLIIDPTNPQEIAAAVGQLLDNPGQAQCMGQQGREMVAKAWNWGKMGSKLAGLYQELQKKETRR